MKTMHEIDLNVLMEYADELKDECRPYDRQIVQECIRKMHEAYNEHNDSATIVNGIIPADKMEGMALSVTGITVCECGDVRWYELPNTMSQTTIRFDEPWEVVQYIINMHNRDSRCLELALMDAARVLPAEKKDELKKDLESILSKKRRFYAAN